MNLRTSEHPPSGIGGKAESWWLLSQAGIPVPRGFCVPVDAPLEAAAIAQELERLAPAEAVAVRSSGIGEDGGAQAMAGLFETLLDVPREVRPVLDAIAKCRAAGSSGRAMSAFGRPVAMGVLVQEMIRPDRSGVLFTRDPRNGEPVVVVEYVDGHLAGLVSGASTARRIVFDGNPPLGFPEAAELVRLGRAVEAVVGFAVDVEWATTGGRVIVLQARPITTLHEAGEEGLVLLPVCPETAGRLPPPVRQHDKIDLRLVAWDLGIAISFGLVGLVSTPDEAAIRDAAARLAGWGEFIMVLLHPFDLDGQIVRAFGHGRSAERDLSRFLARIAPKHGRFAFLAKKLQETASTGVAVRLGDGTVRVEVIHGHFITKGFADPTVYHLAQDGRCLGGIPGRQDVAVQMVDGRKTRVPVQDPIALTEAQLAQVLHATLGLAQRYPEAGIEFGFTPAGEFFLVDLNHHAAASPPDRDDVISEGRLVGRVRRIDVAEDAIEESIERHAHSRRGGHDADHAASEPEIIVVRRPYHVLDQLVYRACPGSLGFVFEEGSLLCHLAVVMREHGVPGLIQVGAFASLVEGETVLLDTRPGSAGAVRRV